MTTRAHFFAYSNTSGSLCHVTCKCTRMQSFSYSPRSSCRRFQVWCRKSQFPKHWNIHLLLIARHHHTLYLLRRHTPHFPPCLPRLVPSPLEFVLETFWFQLLLPPLLQSYRLWIPQVQPMVFLQVALGPLFEICTLINLSKHPTQHSNPRSICMAHESPSFSPTLSLRHLSKLCEQKLSRSSDSKSDHSLTIILSARLNQKF